MRWSTTEDFKPYNKFTVCVILCLKILWLVIYKGLKQRKSSVGETKSGRSHLLKWLLTRAFHYKIKVTVQTWFDKGDLHWGWSLKRVVARRALTVLLVTFLVIFLLFYWFLFFWHIIGMLMTPRPGSRRRTLLYLLQIMVAIWLVSRPCRENMKCWRETWLHWKRRYDNEDVIYLNVVWH